MKRVFHDHVKGLHWSVSLVSSIRRIWNWFTKP